MSEELHRRLADLVVELGANVQPGQIVSVNAEISSRALVPHVAESAYKKRGARFVDPVYFDAQVKRRRIASASEETLEFIPPWYRDRVLALAEHHCARIVLSPLVPPGVLEGLDPAGTGRDTLPYQPETMQVINRRTTNWCLIPSPTLEWARVVHPGLEPEAALERLWEQILHVCRLDEDDPAAAWRRRAEEISVAASRLEERRFDALHFEGPGTDLTVGLLPTSRWLRPTQTTVDGIEHMPNLPTEETASAPDPQRVDGVVSATKPLEVAGVIVRGLRIRFEGGRAISIEADANAEVLRARCALDEGASRLGEVALVNRHGRIGPLGTVFYATLLDENAASHLAFGSAYEACVEAADIDRINRSRIHLDFMIGGDDVAVTGVTRDGGRVPVLRGGDWQL